MNYSEYLKKLGETALAYAENPNAAENADVDSAEVGISGNVTQKVHIGGDGKWTYSLSQYCPINISATASIQDAPSGAVYNIAIDTNYSEHLKFNDVHPGQELHTTIKTNVFSATKITITVTCNVPNSDANFKLHYEV